MDVPQALDRIEEIHAQIAKGEVFRGYRPIPVAVAGAVGLVAGWLQARFVPEGDGTRFLLYWLAVAGLNVTLLGSGPPRRAARRRYNPRRRHLSGPGPVGGLPR